MTFSALIDHPRAYLCAELRFMAQSSVCDKKDASVREIGFSTKSDKTLFTQIADLTRKTLFSGISGFKEALSRRKCMVRLHPGAAHTGARQ
jgi:hypothetical protein